MKIQTIEGITCGTVFAACVDKYTDAEWYKKCTKYMETGNVLIKTVDSDGNVFNGKPINNCCGKKIKS